MTVLIAGIIVSGIMAVKTGKEERKMEQEWIEQEGEKYITAINEEKEKRLEKTTEDVG